ncbi:MAG: class I SAM-dependent methyltransferase [Clostridium argentinense]|uniref:Class I SAM-dependent methyltransferase n=1 Tax=Clostridium faecium TaxID=2762223 RepID=A0ABR8YSK8_9CLOT|nr:MULTISPECIES: class I SAM-dependent methyltransferase [Clostridium]MBD8046961.1 class I SAM-dependent methyltransferase [Clostridium faecium]MBS5823164.1 class I SAM-dependent methyltransferase [Clostridium argentinense]
MKEIKGFDKVYKYYDKFMTMFNLYKHEEIKSAANIDEHDVVVDIGGGTGKLAKYICNSCKTVYVLDESEKMLSMVNQGGNLACIMGNALKTPFEDNSIDIVILSDVFHHIKEQKELIIEINRILRYGGKIVMLDFHRKHIKTKLLRAFEFILFRGLFFRTKDEVRSLLEEYLYIQRVYDKGYYFIFVGEKR